MKYEVVGKKDGRYEIKFSLSSTEWEEAVEQAYEKHRGEYKKEGFRKGKVPRKVLENTYGEYVFYEDAFNDSFPKYYSDMLKKEKDIDPIDYPDIKWDSVGKEGISFTVLVTVMPEVVLGEYKGITIEKTKVSVTDKDVKSELDSYVQKGARFVDVTDRPVENGDLITLDYSGSIDGKVFEGGTAKAQELEIGSKRFIPGFEEQVIGTAIGEEKDINVPFPADYHAIDLAGKNSVFHIKVLSIRKKELPKLDDSFASDVSEFNTLDELKADIKKKITDRKTESADREVENKLVDKIVNASKVEIPSIMVEHQLDSFVDDLKYRLSYQGMKIDDFFKYTNSSEKDFRESRKDEAKKVVKTSLVLEKIIADEKIKVSDADFDAKSEEIAKAQGISVDDLKKDMKDRQKDVVRNNILSEKVIKLLKELNTIK